MLTEKTGERNVTSIFRLKLSIGWNSQANDFFLILNQQ